MQFPVSHVEGPTDIFLKGVTNLFHPLTSLYMIYFMSNYSLHYHPIIDDVELCQNIKFIMWMVVLGRRTKRRHYYDEKYL